MTCHATLVRFRPGSRVAAFSSWGEVFTVFANVSARRWAYISGGVVGGIVVLLVIALGVLWFVQRDRVLPNTEVSGIEVGGLTEPELRAALEPDVDDRETDPVTFEFQDESYSLTAREVGYSIDLESTVETTLRRGREGLPGDIATRIRSLRRGASYEFVRDANPDELEAWVDDLADELDQDEQRGDVRIDEETLEVTVEPSQGLIIVDRTETIGLAHDRLLTAGEDIVDLPAETTPQPIADEELETVAAQAEAALADDLVLTADDADLTLTPDDIYRLIEVVETEGGATGTTLQLEVPEDNVEEELAEIGSERFDESPVDASYSASRTPPATFDAQANATYQPVEASVEVEPGRDGREFVVERASEQLTELVRDGAREAEIDLATVEADLTEERAEELRPTHSIGTFTTYYTAGQSRNQNIQRLADVIDGTLVLPDEQFSINEVSGQRSCDKGYVPAGTIVQGELTDTCGGGTSQFGTTTFNAAFFAGVQLDDWRAHSWYISRYPMGREATLNYPVLDVRFTNNTDGAILVKTSHTASSVTVTLYGQPRANAVSATHSSPTNYRDFDEEERTTSDLAPGQESVLQSGGRGFDVSVTRTVDLVGGGEETRTIDTRYVPQTRIVEKGPEPPSEPDDDDDDDDNDDDNDDD